MLRSKKEETFYICHNIFCLQASGLQGRLSVAQGYEVNSRDRGLDG